MATKEKTKKDILWRAPKGRLIFPHLAKPQRDEKDENDVYSLQLNVAKEGGVGGTFPKALAEMQSVLTEALVQKFGDDWSDEVKLPFIDGDTAPKYKNKDFNHGCICIPMRSYNYAPGMAFVNKDGAIEDFEIDQLGTELYMGCFVVCSYNFYTYSTARASGISVGLRTVIKVADGEPLKTHASTKGDWAGIDMSGYAKTMAGPTEDSDGV